MVNWILSMKTVMVDHAVLLTANLLAPMLFVEMLLEFAIKLTTVLDLQPNVLLIPSWVAALFADLLKAHVILKKHVLEL